MLLRNWYFCWLSVHLEREINGLGLMDLGQNLARMTEMIERGDWR